MTRLLPLILMVLAFGQSLAQESLPKSHNLDSDGGSGSIASPPAATSRFMANSGDV